MKANYPSVTDSGVSVDLMSKSTDNVWFQDNNSESDAVGLRTKSIILQSMHNSLNLSERRPNTGMQVIGHVLDKVRTMFPQTKFMVGIICCVLMRTVPFISKTISDYVASFKATCEWEFITT